MRELIGKSITRAYKDEDCILLQCSDANYLLSPSGDCCAVCTINDVDNSQALVDATVLGVEKLEINFPTPRSDKSNEIEGEYMDVVDTWGHRIITTKGICIIGMRLDHNGYYGGSLDLSKLDRPISGVLLEDFTT